MSEEKIKIYFILPTLFAGGAERVISLVSQNLNKHKFTAVLIVIGFEKDCKYEVNKIDTIYLNKTRVLKSMLSIINILIRDRPNIVMSSISHLNIIMGLISILFPKIKFIGRQTSISNVSSKYNSSKENKIFKLLRIYAMKKFDFIVCQSLDMKKDFMENITFPENKIKIIHNPITQILNFKKVNSTEKKVKQFITVGRLGKIKGHLRLLNMLSKLKISYKYTIIGEGNEKEAIFNRIKELNLNDKIEYIPYTDNVSKHLEQSDFFLQGSFAEGFPNALLESCAVGTPAIAYNVLGGTNEIIQHGVNGFIVNEEEEFVNLLNNNSIYNTFNPTIVSESVSKKFSKNIIVKKYEDLFLSLIKSSNQI